MKSKRELLDQLTLREKCDLGSGSDTWHSKHVPRLGIRSLLMHDGPHGLRKQLKTADHLGLNESVPATCFPTAGILACSFDRELLWKIGAAVGSEALEQEIDIVLGPGVNIKRSPLCGRNFEYFSEDPLLTGELAAAFIRGVQSQGVGTSLKHFAAYNQEFCRLINNSQIDERALREIYLKPFEIAVRKAQPWTVMASYNRLNGEYSVQHRELLTEILRKDWGFAGLVVTDWAAMDNRLLAVESGSDLEMPNSGRQRDQMLFEAAQHGKVDLEAIDRSVLKLLELIEKCDHKNEKPGREVYDLDHSLAREALRESAVLLKNEAQILPLQPGQKVLLVGELAKQPHYQGSGSSRVNPTRLVSLTQACADRNLGWTFLPGYEINRQENPETLREEACRAAAGMDAVVVVAGLTEDDEAEGYDRQHLLLQEEQNKLIEALAWVNPNLIVVLQGGGAMILPWLEKVKGVLYVGTAGQAFGEGTLDLLLGDANPSGKLAESWPLALTDVPCQPFYGQRYNSPYQESIYVGYRFYASSGKAVCFPFGHGLSYTSFELSGLTLSASRLKSDDTLRFSFKVRNMGSRAGKLAAQFYIRPPRTTVFKADRELKGFIKIELQPAEERLVSCELPVGDLAFWNSLNHSWQVEAGEYELLIGQSSLDLPLAQKFEVEPVISDPMLPDFRGLTPQYYQLTGDPQDFGREQFEKLPGSQAVEEPRLTTGHFDLNSTLWEARHTWQGRLVTKVALRISERLIANTSENTGNARRTVEASTLDAPLRSFVMGGIKLDTIEGMRDLLNLRIFRGLWKILKGMR